MPGPGRHGTRRRVAQGASDLSLAVSMSTRRCATALDPCDTDAILSWVFDCLLSRQLSDSNGARTPTVSPGSTATCCGAGLFGQPRCLRPGLPLPPRARRKAGDSIGDSPPTRPAGARHRRTRRGNFAAFPHPRFVPYFRPGPLPRGAGMFRPDQTERAFGRGVAITASL